MFRFVLIGIGVVALLFMMSAGWYQSKYHTLRWPKVKARILSGERAGAVGTVVSYAPFDLWVTINTEATDAEKEAFRKERYAKWGEAHRDWIEDNARRLRSWPTVCRGNVEWIPQEGYDVTGRINP
jgi:transposase